MAATSRSSGPGSTGTAPRRRRHGQPSGFDAGMIVGVSTLVLRNSTVERQSRHRPRCRDRRQRRQRRRARARRNRHAGERAGLGNSTTVTATGNAAAYGALQVFGQGGVGGHPRLDDQRERAPLVQRRGRRHRPGRRPRQQRASRAPTRSASATTPRARRGRPASRRAEGSGTDVVFVPPPVQLQLVDTVVTRNSVEAAAASCSRGRRLTAFPIEATRSRIAGNMPDDCFGC